MNESGVERQIQRGRERLARLRAQAGVEDGAPDSPIHEAVEELEQTLEALSITLEELLAANREAGEARHATEDHARRYLDLFQLAPDPYVVTDERGVILELNLRAVQQLGRSASHLTGRPLLPLLAPADRRAFLGHLAALRERGERIEDQPLRFGGRYPFEASVSAVLELRDEALEIRWILRDVTARLRAEREVRVAEARIRAVLDAAQDGILHLDPDGTIRMVNPALCRTFAYDHRELAGRHVLRLMPALEWDRPDLEEKSGWGESGGPVGAGREVEGVRSDGSRIPVQVSIGRVEGSQPGFVCVLRDLTDERLLQRRLREAAGAATVAEERERRRLAVDLHDDVGQLLVLAGMRLAMLAASAPDGAFTAALREVQELVTRAHRHTDSLGLQLSPSILHDVGLTAAAEWLGEDLGRSYRLRVRVESDGEPPLSLAERVTLFRALRELLINVARHAGTDKAIVRLQQSPSALTVSVEDDGGGIDPQRESTGFGLMSVRERVEGMGGRFEIASNGRGTCAQLTVPLSARASG